MPRYWVDLTCPAGEVAHIWRANVAKRLNKVTFPSFIVSSGRGIQAYWRLTACVALENRPGADGAQSPATAKAHLRAKRAEAVRARSGHCGPERSLMAASLVAL